MATTKQQDKKAVPGFDPNYNPMLSIADAEDIKYSLEEMFYAYVWTCVGRSEQDHEKICAVYHGLLTLLDRSNSTN